MKKKSRNYHVKTHNYETTALAYIEKNNVFNPLETVDCCKIVHTTVVHDLLYTSSNDPTFVHIFQGIRKHLFFGI